MKRSPMKPVRPHQIPPHVRREVHRRDEQICQCCGAWLGVTGAHLHHRKLRSQGGEDTVANLVTVCSPCHFRIHSNPALSYKLGFLVSREDDPAVIPVRSLWPVGDDFDGGAA